MNIAQALEGSTAELLENNVPDARLDASLLVSFAVSRDKTFLVAHPEFELTDEQESHLFEITKRRIAREPLQYITGRQEFFRLAFEVTPEVLIPRPETEILVERAIDFLSTKNDPRFCEVGTGSGCISVSVLHELPNSTAFACDISERALAVARRNAERNLVDDRLELVVSDVFECVPRQRFDAILSNPPYVPENDLATLQPEVRDHEPTIALTSGIEGLNVIRRLIDTAPSYLETGGLLLFEMGFNQSAKVGRLLDPLVWTAIEFLPDLQGIPRILSAVKQ